MKKIFDYISLAAVILLMHGVIQNFELKAGYLHGPLNPYVFFTDDVRSSLEQASSKVVKGDFSAEDARDLLRKYGVCRCYVYKGDICWTIPYFYHNMAFSVDYIYSPGESKAPLERNDEIQSLGNGWYWGKNR